MKLSFIIGIIIISINMNLFSQDQSFNSTNIAEKFWKCGQQFKDTVYDISYNTVLIGNQCWFAENINTGIVINGFEIMTDNDVIEKYCYENKPYNCEIFGGLYQWNEMMEYDSTEKSRGICPRGWHIPSDSEWIALESFAETDTNNSEINWDTIGYRGTNAGSHLKSRSCWLNKGNGTDTFNFTALASGIRLFSGYNFGDLHNLGFYWTSSTYKENEAWQRIFDSSTGSIRRKGGAIRNGRSVRCIKD